MGIIVASGGLALGYVVLRLVALAPVALPDGSATRAPVAADDLTRGYPAAPEPVTNASEDPPRAPVLDDAALARPSGTVPSPPADLPETRARSRPPATPPGAAPSAGDRVEAGSRAAPRGAGRAAGWLVLDRCRMPAVPGVVVGAETGRVLGLLAATTARLGQCFYVIRRPDGALWEVAAPHAHVLAAPG